MACHQKNQCTYSDQSEVRVVVSTSVTGPRKCATPFSLVGRLPYSSPGVWSGVVNGLNVVASTDGSPGGWTVTLNGAPPTGSAPESACLDEPIGGETVFPRNDCQAYKRVQNTFYSDDSEVWSILQVDVLNNAGCE